MKRLFFIICCGTLILTGCMNKQGDNIVQTEEKAETEISIIPNYSLSDNLYRVMLPYKPGAARGTITNQLVNRVDIDQLEEGLQRHSTAVFDPKKYVFEEGQYLSKDDVFTIIDGLNPDVKDLAGSEQADSEKITKKIKEKRKNPRVFSHILEQNYLKKNKDQTASLVGVSIGIALKSVYRFQVETGGPYYYEDIPKEEMLKVGEKVAKKVLKELREKEGLQNVPILIALFREEAQSSPVPGKYVAKTVVGKGENKVGKWESINEEHILFPSEKAKEKYNDDYQKVKMFSEKVAEYFPNFVGVIGNGFYINKDLTQLTIEVPIEFYGKTEIIGFTQYAFGQLKETFPNHYDIEISVTSSNGAESLIYRKAGEKEPQVHIFH